MANLIVSDLVLIESKSARDNHLAQMPHERAQSILNKVKALYFALWQGTGAATTEQMKEFYEVKIDAIEAALRRCRNEFQSDGVKTLKRRQLKEFKQLSASEAESSNAASLTTWTPRAALRLGMVLQNSPVAKAVRTSLLDAAEAIPPAVEKVQELELELAIAQAQRETAQAQQQAAQANGETAKTQERLMLTSQAIAAMHGTGMVALILGNPDAVVEPPPTIVEKTVLVNPSGKPLAVYQGISKTKLAKRYGMKKPQDVVSWLQTIGKAGLLQRGLTATPCEFVPWEFVKELDQAWSERRGSRQRLLGE